MTDRLPSSGPIRGRDAVRCTASAVRRSEWRPRRGAVLRLDAPTGSPADAGAEPLPPVLIPLLDALRSSVTAYVGGRRREGVPIWRVLPEVKALVHEADPDVGRLDTLAPLLDQVVRWTIAAYYDVPTPAAQRAV